MGRNRAPHRFVKSAAFVVALCALLVGLPLRAVADAAADSASPAIAAIVDAIAAKEYPRVAAALARIEGTHRRLLALRGYLRAGPCTGG